MTIEIFDGKKPTIAARVFVHQMASVIGEVTIGEDVSIWPMAVVRGDMNSIQIGHRSNIQDGSILHVMPDCEYYPGGHPLKIGEDVTVAHGVNLHGCTIGNRCIIGIGTIVLDGAIIEDDVMTGAGTLVLPGKTLKSGHVYLGSPAKQIRPLTDKEKCWLKELAHHYIDLKNQYA